MIDLYLATAISLSISAALCALCLRAAPKLSRPVATTVVFLTTAFLFVHAFYLLDDLRVARMIPHSAAIILGNFSPYAVAVIVGLGWHLIPGGMFRKGLILLPLLAVCLHKAYAPALVTEPLTLGDRWDHDVCRQTTDATCSPAAAATLLRAYGIRTTEQEMAALCRTTSKGTTMLGLYRGLKLKTRDTHYEVEIFHGPYNQLRGLTGAMLVTAGLPSHPPPDLDPRYQRDWGWPPGLKHTVVLFDFNGRDVEIGDPAVGRERWTVKDLETLWHGEALRLIRRQQ